MAAAAAIGGALAGGSSGGASIGQYQASKHERNIAWKRQQAWELMAPSLRVAGLKQAGLNPILAATQGMTGGATNVGMADAGSTPHFDSDIVGRAVSSAKQAKAMGAELAILREQAAQQSEATKQAAIQTASDLQELAIFQKYGWKKADLEISSGSEGLINLIAERGLTSAREKEAGQAVRNMMTTREMMETGLPGARAMEDWYEKNPWARVLREYSGGGLGGAVLGAGAAAGGYMFGEKKGASHERHKNQDFNRAFDPKRPPNSKRGGYKKR